MSDKNQGNPGISRRNVIIAAGAGVAGIAGAAILGPWGKLKNDMRPYI